MSEVSVQDQLPVHREDSEINEFSTTERTIPSKSLYISHFISTWNSRGFEFGAILFLATIYPGTLMPMSIYALIRACSAILLSPLVGRYIDTKERLVVVRVSIIGQRLSVILSCFGFLFLLVGKKDWATQYMIFAIVILLACVEKLCSIMNTVSVERDWVVVIADNQEEMLQEMNSQMRRIDLFCKLVSPLAIALLDGLSSRIAIFSTLGVNAITVGVEYYLIARVYKSTPALASRNCTVSNLPEPITTGEDQFDQTIDHSEHAAATSALKSYISSAAFLPSLSLSILYLTVLSFSGQMTTFLLAIPSPRMTSTTVGLLRTVSTAFELSSTYIAPILMTYIGAIRAGIWFLSWQTICLTTGVGLFWITTTSKAGDTTQTSGFGILALVAAVILSRVGLWSFDLVAQLHIQHLIEPSNRGSFSSVEASLQNFFELLTFASTIIWSRPEQFKFPALVSLIATYVAAGLYAGFVRNRRGHLVHLPACFKGDGRHGYKVVTTGESEIESDDQ